MLLFVWFYHCVCVCVCGCPSALLWSNWQNAPWHILRVLFSWHPPVWFKTCIVAVVPAVTCRPDVKCSHCIFLCAWLSVFFTFLFVLCKQTFMWTFRDSTVVAWLTTQSGFSMQWGKCFLITCLEWLLASSFASHPHKPDKGLCVQDCWKSDHGSSKPPTAGNKRYSQLPVSLV